MGINGRRHHRRELGDRPVQLEEQYIPGTFAGLRISVGIQRSLADEVLDIHQRDAENTMRELAARKGFVALFRRRGCRRVAS